MDDEGGRHHARRSYRGRWLFQQDAFNIRQQQCAGQYPARLERASRFVAGGALDVSARLVRSGGLIAGQSCNDCASRPAVQYSCSFARRFQAGVGHLRLGDPGLRSRRADLRDRYVRDACIDSQWRFELDVRRSGACGGQRLEPGH